MFGDLETKLATATTQEKYSMLEEAKIRIEILSAEEMAELRARTRRNQKEFFSTI